MHVAPSNTFPTSMPSRPASFGASSANTSRHFSTRRGASISIRSGARWWGPIPLFIVLAAFWGLQARAQTCFFYSDSVYAPVPIQCVKKTDHTKPCSWPTDCDLIVNPTDQTILRMHELWHDCFGNVGGGSPPVGRGQRWYAFHRQFEYDFNHWRNDHGYSKIEHLTWCKDMVMPEGHPSAKPGGYILPNTSKSADLTKPDPGDPTRFRHVSLCGFGNARPGGVHCKNCEAFPPCLFYSGAGSACPGGEKGDSTKCLTGITKLEDFANVDQVSLVLDDYFHGKMHMAVGDADGTPYVLDVQDPACGTRDPMFWRLHAALDDVVRAWQDHKAVDVILVIDRSGSMSEPDKGSGKTKLEAALQAADMFADLLDRNRLDGAMNRIGIVGFSTTAKLYLPLTVADASLRMAGQPLPLALNQIKLDGPAGCTATGLGIQKAVDELCPGGTCDGFVPPVGKNTRKAILLLTDGVENLPPCLQSAKGAGGGCGGQCFGTQFDYNKLKFVQLCAVGFGDSGSLNGDLLSLLAERQGGIYTQNPNSGVGNDLKKFFVTAYGQLTDELLFKDPSGFLGATDPASAPVTYDLCSDSKLTFASGWQTPVIPGDLMLLVTTPGGDLVRPGDAGIQSSLETAWDYKRIRMPYRGQSSGTWRAQLVRPHRTFVNGFTTDCFLNPSLGVALVRREIQRLCHGGCSNVLYFEDGRLGANSVYELALQAEVESGLIAPYTQLNNAVDFAQTLNRGWDLIVYARQFGPDQPELYDGLFASWLCQGQRAIITDTRQLANGSEILRCAGAQPDGTNNWNVLAGDGRLLDGALQLTNPGYPIFSYGLRPAGGLALATTSPGGSGAIVARAAIGVDEYWFISALGSGLSKLDPHLVQSLRRTGDDLLATVRMLPSYYRAGGYDTIDARVEVTYPLDGLGNIFTQGLRPATERNGEILDGRFATLSSSNSPAIPTGVATFPLYDDGTHGDAYANNQYWTAVLAGIGRFDGMYQMRYLFDFTAAGCTTHRELVQSVFVDSRADAAQSTISIGPGALRADGRTSRPVRLTPRDVFGNYWGPGRAGLFECNNPLDCEIAPQSLVDNLDGSYSFMLLTPPDVASVRLDAFNGPIDLAIPCANCPRLVSLALNPPQIEQLHSCIVTVQLSGPAPAAGAGGALVYLTSSDREVASLPESVLVPAGSNSFSFVLADAHGDDDARGSNRVALSASYGGDTRTSLLTVLPPSAPLVPFEITDLSLVTTQLQINFISPYSPARHLVQVRTTLNGSNGWTTLSAPVAAAGSNSFQATLARPPSQASFYRISTVPFPGPTNLTLATPAKPFGGAAPTDAVPLRKSAYRKTASLVIPDAAPAGIIDTFDFPDDLAMTDVNVFLNITHPWVGDLVVEITSPEGTTVRLRERSGSPAANVVGWCGSPGVGDRLNLQKLLMGQSAAGPWKLRVIDEGQSDRGTLNEWGVNVTGFARRPASEKYSALARPAVSADLASFPSTVLRE